MQPMNKFYLGLSRIVYFSVGCLPILKKKRGGDILKLFKSISGFPLKNSEDRTALGLLSHLAAVSWS